MSVTYFDTSDVQDAIGELVQRFRDYIGVNTRIDRHLVLNRVFCDLEDNLKHIWEMDLQKILLRREITMYHVCYTEQADRILQYGIYHGPTPTLTPSLVAAIARAENDRCHHVGIEDITKTILKCVVPVSAVFYVETDHMGPGFLPKEKKKMSQTPEGTLPDVMRKVLFKVFPEGVYWLNPIFFEEKVYTIGDKNSEDLITKVSSLR
ncbi:TPA: hypothetical protein HA241_02855 [Candidatus Woesearchaeota archaeon]|nr:hypothetical protein [Candidatus Woesearchaeota archaeon]